MNVNHQHHFLRSTILLISALLLISWGTSVFSATDEVAKMQDTEKETAATAHSALFIEKIMPAASTCKNCHPKQYDQWSVSQHAYAQLSPVYHSFQAAVFKLTNGTNGDFCIRCHNPVGMNIGEPLFMNNMDRSTTSKEGITCITCHRVNKRLGKVNGRLPIVQGDMTQPVYGPSGNENLEKTLKTPGLKVTTEQGQRGRKIHKKVEKFSFLTEPGFCGTCHDVTLVNGFRLEEAFSEYKHSPAAARGETCQDCHMGKIPGVASGYEQGPAAIVNGKSTPSRKLTDHRFVGPDYSVVHAGFFPHNNEAAELATMREWLLYDYRAGWGTDEFEDKIDAETLKVEFPERWSDPDDRIEAREIIDVQLERLEEMRQAREALLRRAYLLGEPEIKSASKNKLAFRIPIRNGTDGHNIPTGFTGERLVWLQVDVTDATGKVIFQSGDLDPNGDVRDLHSLYVHNGELPLDRQLFNLQSPFITRNNRGSEHEQVLAINFSPDPLPFLRPDVRPTSLSGRTLGARIHKRSIESNGTRWAKYKVNLTKLEGKAPFEVSFRLMAAMIPVNLINAISVVGFDYNMSPREIADRVVEGHTLVAEQKLQIKLPAEE